MDWLNTAVDIIADINNPISTIEFFHKGAKRVAGILSWLDSALELLGDIVDPVLPGFAGSELRPTSRKVTVAGINAQRRAAGLSPLGGRRRRRRALTKSDREDIGFIAGMISKAAARDFAMIVAGGR